MTPPGPELHVFVIRARREPRELPGAPAVWKFWVEHHPTGRRQYFGSLDEVLRFVAGSLPADAVGILTSPRAH